jgi:hypothetical protein
MMKVERCMKRGCQAYLAYEIKEKTKLRGLGDVPVVCDFPDVFPDDLSRVPPDLGGRVPN